MNRMRTGSKAEFASETLKHWAQVIAQAKILDAHIQAANEAIAIEFINHMKNR